MLLIQSPPHFKPHRSPPVLSQGKKSSPSSTPGGRLCHSLPIRSSPGRPDLGTHYPAWVWEWPSRAAGPSFAWVPFPGSRIFFFLGLSPGPGGAHSLGAPGEGRVEGKSFCNFECLIILPPSCLAGLYSKLETIFAPKALPLRSSRACTVATPILASLHEIFFSLEA